MISHLWKSVKNNLKRVLYNCLCVVLCMFLFILYVCVRSCTCVLLLGLFCC